MGPTTNPPSIARRFWRGCLAATINVVVPVLLAWGLARALHRHLHPADVRDVAAERNTYGQIRLHLKLPGTHAGILEPLISCGRIGDASLVFIRLLPKSQARVGVEFWGLELDEGTAFAVPAPDAEIDLTCDLPACYPDAGDAAWGKTPPAEQQLRLHQYRIAVNGVVRLQGSVNYHQPPHSPLYFGINPLGGSFVSNRFTGKILRITQGF
jgi:hypothetical protein